MELSENDHVLLFPFPANGHIKPYLCLAQLLCNAGLRVTFLNTHYNHRRIIHHRHRLAARFPSLHFESISDGLPLDKPRDILGTKFHISMLKTAVQAFRDLLLSYTNNETSSGRPPITCLIIDVVWRFPIDAAEELGVPVLCFCTYSTVYLFLHFWIPKLIEDGQLPYPVGKMDQKLHGAGALPEAEELLRCKDLPVAFAFEGEIKDERLGFVRQTMSTSRSSALIINTFDDLKAPFLTSLSKTYKKIYTVGPIHSLLKNNSDCAGLGKDEEEGDRSCLGWLDTQASRSVVFASFGTVVKIASSQLMELWNGLVDNGKPFLLVLRSESIKGDDGKQVVREIMETKAEGRWVIVSWAPQEEVLGHEAVGGFLTHCGWNSTLESIVCGVPMICRPQFGDQLTHRIWVSKAWKIGLGMEEPYDRSTVETMVRSIMEQEQEGEKINNRIAELAKQAKDTVGKDGTSFRNLQSLIEHIKKINHS